MISLATPGKAIDAEKTCTAIGGELPVPMNEQENTDYYNAFVKLNKNAKNGALGKISVISIKWYLFFKASRIRPLRAHGRL